MQRAIHLLKSVMKNYCSLSQGDVLFFNLLNGTIHVVIICRGVLPVSGEGTLGGRRKEKRHSLSLSLGSDLRMALALVISLIFVHGQRVLWGSGFTVAILVNNSR